MKRRPKILTLMRYLTVPAIALVVGGGFAMSAFRAGEPVAVAPAVVEVAPEAEAPLRPSFLAPGARLDAVLPIADGTPETAPVPPVASEPPVRVVATLAVEPAEPVQPTEPAAPQARVGDSAVNVRSGPANGNAKLFVLMPGEPVEVAGSDGGWLQVTTADGRSGWVYSKYIQRPDATAQ